MSEKINVRFRNPGMFVLRLLTCKLKISLIPIFLQTEMALTTARAHPPQHRGRLSRGTANLPQTAASGQSASSVPAATVMKPFVQSELEVGW